MVADVKSCNCDCFTIDTRMEWQGGSSAAVSVVAEVATRDTSASSSQARLREVDVDVLEEGEQRRQRVDEALAEEENQRPSHEGSTNVRAGSSDAGNARKKEGDIGMSGAAEDNDDDDGEEKNEAEDKKKETAGSAAAAGGKEESTSSGNHAVCSICFDAVTVTSEERSTARLKCGHMFHLGEWRADDCMVNR